MDPFEKLKQTKALYDERIISEEEYQKLKARLLSEIEKAHVENPGHNASPGNARTSTNVGASVNPTPAPAANKEVVTAQPSAFSQSGASGGMKALSFLIPLAGFILFLVNQNTKPVEAKDELKWAGIGFAVYIIFYILLVGCTAAAYY